MSEAPKGLGSACDVLRREREALVTEIEHQKAAKVQAERRVDQWQAQITAMEGHILTIDAALAVLS